MLCARIRSYSLLLLVLALAQASSAQAACLPPPAGLIAWWPGEGSPYDQAGNHHAIPSAGMGFALAVVDTGFLFAGTNAFLTVPADTSLDLSSGRKFSFAAWMQVAAGSPATQFVLDKRVASTGGCGARGYAVYLSGGRVGIQIDGPAGCVNLAATVSMARAVSARIASTTEVA